MRERIISLLYVVAVLFAAVSFRAAYIQLWDGPNSGKALAASALKFRTLSLTAEETCRGEILDRKMCSLTDSGVRPALVAFPSAIKDINSTAHELEAVLGLDAGTFANRIKRWQETYGQRSPLVLKVNLTDEEAAKLSELKIHGIAVVPIRNRYGPQSLARHLIGHLNMIDAKKWEDLCSQNRTLDTNPGLPTAYRITDRIGVSGLERKYEEVLKGAKAENEILAVTDANGQILPGLGYKVRVLPADPWRNHLILTLDKRCQEAVEQAMDKNISRGAAVVLDIQSGDVLAVASRPNFDQNDIGKFVDGYDELIDRTQRVAFYPGSVFKMVCAAGVLEEGLVSLEETIECTGKHVFNDETQINCLQTHGAVTLFEAIGKSCNAAFVQLGLRLGGEKLAAYAGKLGFAININKDSPPAMVGNATIGQQGVLVSPLQIANLYATIARNGIYQPIRIVSEVRNHRGDVIQDYPPSPPVRVLSSKTCETLKDALLFATQNGSSRPGWVEDVGSAGKTGTAQINETGKVIAWFAGYAPLENPRFVIVVMIEEDNKGAQTGLRGGETAGPVFKEIAKRLLADS